MEVDFEDFYIERKKKRWIAPVFVALLNSDKEVILNFEHSSKRWLCVEEAIDTFEFHYQKEIVREIKRVFLDKKPLDSFIV